MIYGENSYPVEADTSIQGIDILTQKYKATMADDSKKKIIYDRGGEENGLTIHWMNRKQLNTREALQLLEVEHKSKRDEVQSLNLQAHKYNQEISDGMMQGKVLQDKNISLTERYERQLTKMNDTIASKDLVSLFYSMRIVYEYCLLFCKELLISFVRIPNCFRKLIC